MFSLLRWTSSDYKIGSEQPNCACLSVTEFWTFELVGSIHCTKNRPVTRPLYWMQTLIPHGLMASRMLEPDRGTVLLFTILINTPTVASAGPALRGLKRPILSAVRHKLTRQRTMGQCIQPRVFTLRTVNCQEMRQQWWKMLYFFSFFASIFFLCFNRRTLVGQSQVS